MTDSKLRELERRWKQTGSVEDEAAYLLERVRVGDLSKDKLELAAYCGHEAARNALDQYCSAAVPLPTDALAPDPWLVNLPPLPRDGAIAALAALLSEAARRLTLLGDSDAAQAAAGGAAAAKKWLKTPSAAIAADLRNRLRTHQETLAAYPMAETLEYLLLLLDPDLSDSSRLLSHANIGPDLGDAAYNVSLLWSEWTPTERTRHLRAEMSHALATWALAEIGAQ